MRSSAREALFKYLFSELFNPSDEELFAVLLNEKNINKSDMDFAKKLYENICENKELYLDEIQKLSTNFKLNRIFNADKCALLIGMAEYNTFKDTPIPVIIDEAVKLSSIYSTEKSTNFVNGILAMYINK